jgi:hypothetical protein
MVRCMYILYVVFIFSINFFRVRKRALDMECEEVLGLKSKLVQYKADLRSPVSYINVISGRIPTFGGSWRL